MKMKKNKENPTKQFFKVEDANRRRHFITLEKQQDELLQDYQTEGVYVLIFPNGKKAIGKSSNIAKDIKQHYHKLFTTSLSNNGGWQFTAKMENPFMKPSDIEIIIIPIDEDIDKEMLDAFLEDRSELYNKRLNFLKK